MTHLYINGLFLDVFEINCPFFDYFNLQMSMMFCYFVVIYDLLTSLN